jgi:uncharacterized protein (TIGR04255 family)
MGRTSPPLHLKKSPLVYVLAQVVIPADLLMKEYIPAIQKELRHKGYIRYQEVQSQAIIFATDLKLTPSTRWIFSNKENQEAIVISPESIVFETTKYNVFDTFIQSLESLLEMIQKIVNVGLSERIGLRYVNALRTFGDESFSDYLKPGLLGLSQEEFGVQQTFYRFEIVASTTAGQLVLRLSKSNDGLPPDLTSTTLTSPLQLNEGETIMLLDIDHFSIQQRDFIPSDLVQSMWQLHEYTDKSFRAAVTERAFELWESEQMTHS